jgi:hypothetical protein
MVARFWEFGADSESYAGATVRVKSNETQASAVGNGEDRLANWNVQTGKDPDLPLFWENVAECLARVIGIGEDAAAMRLL